MGSNNSQPLHLVVKLPIDKNGFSSRLKLNKLIGYKITALIMVDTIGAAMPVKKGRCVIVNPTTIG